MKRLALRIRRALPVLALIVSSAGVGSALIFVRLSEVDPSATMMLRMFTAGLLLGIAHTVSGRGVPMPVERGRRFSLRLAGALILSSALFCLDILSNHWAAVYTSVGNAALLMNLSPVFVGMLAYLAWGERLSIAQICSLALAILGSVLIIATGPASAPHPRSWIGDGLALLSAAFYALYLVMTKWIRTRLGAEVITFWNSMISALLLLPLVLLTSNPVLPATASGYATILALAVVAQLLGHGLMAYALRHVSATWAAATTLSQPVLAALLAWIVLGEAMTGIQAIGAVLILSGLYLYSLPSPRRRVAEA